MKAARLYKQQWEEANWLRLIHVANQLTKIFNAVLKCTVIAAHLILFINYQVIKYLLLIVNLLLLTEPSINRVERDETWIFRQIK